MALLEQQLYIKKSKLPNAGKGLFTRKFIPKGQRIVEYKGRKRKWTEAKHEDGYNGYLMKIDSRTVIDALPAMHTYGRYANDAKGLTRIENARNNCEYITDGKKCFIEATRDIKPFEEIYVGYGAEYWTLIKKIRNLNTKLSTSLQRKRSTKKLKSRSK